MEAYVYESRLCVKWTDARVTAVPADYLSTADCISPADWSVTKNNNGLQQTVDKDTVTGQRVMQ